MIITIFGLPGSGKATQSSMLIVRYNLGLISVGDLLRNIISSKSKLGKKIKNVVESGNLIQDRVICNILHKQLSLLVDDNFLLDGFPRNLNQARFLTQTLLEKYNRDLDIAIELQIDDKVAINRLKSRLVCLDCKSVYSTSFIKNNIHQVFCIKCKSIRLRRRIDDSNLSSINRRIMEYYIQIEGLRKYYQDKLLTVNANLDADQVMQEIESKVSCNLI